MSSTQKTILQYLAREESGVATYRTLCEFAGLTWRGFHRTRDAMERAGVVEIATPYDGTIKLRITEAGRAALSAALRQ